MSANNQTLIQEHNGKYYVFDNVMAESWCEYDDEKKVFDETRINEIHLKSAIGVFDTEEEAYAKAREIDDTEYGICIGRLAKDDAEVKII